MTVIAPAYGAALESGVPSLLAQLDAAVAEKEAANGTAPEPALAQPHPEGPLAGRQP